MNPGTPMALDCTTCEEDTFPEQLNEEQVLFLQIIDQILMPAGDR